MSDLRVSPWGGRPSHQNRPALGQPFLCIIYPVTTALCCRVLVSIMHYRADTSRDCASGDNFRGCQHCPFAASLPCGILARSACSLGIRWYALLIRVHGGNLADPASTCFWAEAGLPLGPSQLLPSLRRTPLLEVSHQQFPIISICLRALARAAGLYRLILASIQYHNIHAFQGCKILLPALVGGLQVRYLLNFITVCAGCRVLVGVPARPVLPQMHGPDLQGTSAGQVSAPDHCRLCTGLVTVFCDET